MGLTSTGSVMGLSRIYVDSRAGGAGADGSADKPFRTIEEALAVVPDVSDEASLGDMILRLRTLVLAGTFGDVAIAIPVGIDNTSGVIGALTCTASLLLVTGGYISELIVEGSETVRIQNASVDEAAIEDASVTFTGCTIGEITLAGSVGGHLGIGNSVVTEELTVPAEYTATAYNSMLVNGAVGTITDYNSGIGT